MSAIENKVGLIAGWGSFPVEVAEFLRARNIETHVIAIKGHADPRLEALATKVKWKGVLSLGGHLRFFKKENVRQVVLAGKLFKDRILYHGRGWIDHVPDLTCFRILGGNFITRKRDGRDDSIMQAVVAAFETQNMAVLPITEVAPHLLARAGCLTKRQPNRREFLDLKFGWQIARKMGGLDIGQSITVRDQVVLAVEAIEGTDALIQRTGELCPRGGFTLIKVAKPSQNMKFDVPTIGSRTVQQLARAGGTAIAIEANRTILVEREQTLRLANQLGIKIISLNSADDNLSASDAIRSEQLAAEQGDAYRQAG